MAIVNIRTCYFVTLFEVRYYARNTSNRTEIESNITIPVQRERPRTTLPIIRTFGGDRMTVVTNTKTVLLLITSYIVYCPCGSSLTTPVATYAHMDQVNRRVWLRV